MTRLLIMLIVGGLLFGASATASWFLRPPAEELSAKTGVDSMPTADIDSPAPSGDTATTGTNFPSHGIPAETVLRLGESIKKRELQLKQREELVEEREKRLKFMIDDLQRERVEISAMLEDAEDRTQTARTLLEQVQQNSLNLSAAGSTQTASALDGQPPTDIQQPISDQEKRNLRTVAEWLQGMPPEQSAEAIRQFCNDGKTEMAVQLLAFLEQRDASKILGRLGRLGVGSRLAVTISQPENDIEEIVFSQNKVVFPHQHEHVMNPDQMVQLLQEFLYLGLLLVAPAVLTSMLVGLLIAIFQTITSIQEQTLTFRPRIVAVAVIIALTLTWSLNLLIGFTERLFSQMSGILA